jgi:hypothetical protein
VEAHRRDPVAERQIRRGKAGDKLQASAGIYVRNAAGIRDVAETPAIHVSIARIDPPNKSCISGSV